MKNKKGILIAIICIVVIVGGYLFFVNREQTGSEDVELTEVQRVITKDLAANYPATPREVLKAYNEIITCYYNEECTEEELSALADRALLLMDEELAANNPKAEYLVNVKAEIATYDALGKTIVSTNLDSSNEVEYRTVDERECAYIDVSYFIKSDEGYTRSYMTYVLRKDENSNWKILVFYLDEGAASNEE